MRQRIYRKGRKLSMTARLLRQEYVFLFDRPTHPGFMSSMQFNVLAMLCRRRGIRAAIRRDQ